MPEEVLFETERKQSRGEVADYLRTVADRLDGGDSITLSASGDSLTLDPPASVTFEVKAERETGSGPDEHSVEFELEWDESDAGASEDTGLDIS